jgi:hypothetical protein
MATMRDGHVLVMVSEWEWLGAKLGIDYRVRRATACGKGSHRPAPIPDTGYPKLSVCVLCGLVGAQEWLKRTA